MHFTWVDFTCLQFYEAQSRRGHCRGDWTKMRIKPENRSGNSVEPNMGLYTLKCGVLCNPPPEEDAKGQEDEELVQCVN